MRPLDPRLPRDLPYRRVRRALSFAPASLLSAVLFAGCLDGTSTDTPNTLRPGTLEGAAFRADGTPAAGARVSVRSGRVSLDASGRPDYVLLDADVADAKGRFAVDLPAGTLAYLEILVTDSTDRGRETQVYFDAFDAEAARPTRFTEYPLKASGSLEGRLIPTKGKPLEGNWIAVPGTSAMVRLDAPSDSGGIPFRLDGLYPGPRELEILSGIGVAVMSTPGKLPVGQVKPAEVTDLGSIFYNETLPAVVAPD